MSKWLKIYGSPEASVFGIIDAVIDSDNNKTYIKVSNDTLNIGWQESGSISPTPTPVPTPTIDPYSTFSCSELHITGSVKCGNPVIAGWSLPQSASVSCSIQWTNAASPSDVVSIYGNSGLTASLNSGQTSYVFSQSLSNGSDYNIKLFRNSATIDTTKIKLYIHSGSNFSSVNASSYASGSTPLLITAQSITGSYKYHLRINSKNDTWSNVRYFTSQIFGISGATSGSILFGEVVGPNFYFSFPVNSPLDCGDIPPVPGPTPTPPAVACQRFWIDYDYLGRIQASWKDCSGVQKSIGPSTGIPYTTAISDCHQVDTLSIPYGVNFRFAECSDPDPRTGAYQIDATYNADGQFYFGYIDPFDNPKTVYQEGPSFVTVYGVACGKEITNNFIGQAVISNRDC